MIEPEPSFPPPPVAGGTEIIDGGLFWPILQGVVALIGLGFIFTVGFIVGKWG